MKMKCTKVKKMFSSLLDNELQKEVRVDVESHLGRCEMCRRDLEELKEIKTLLTSLPTPVMPGYLTSRIVARLQETEIRHQVVTPLVWRVAAGLLITVGLWLGVMVGGGLAVNGGTNNEIATLNAEPSIDEFFAGWR